MAGASFGPGVVLSTMRTGEVAGDCGYATQSEAKGTGLPTPAVARAYYGVATARSEPTEREVRTRLLGYPRIDVDEEVTRVAGRLLAEADDRAGEDTCVGANEAYIAAMAGGLGDAVLTNDVDGFAVLGVSSETYRAGPV